MIRPYTLILLAVVLISCDSTQNTASDTVSVSPGSSEQTITFTVSKEITLQYLCYVPPEFDSAGTALWPLVIYLHGYNAVGSDLNLVKTHGLPRKIEEGTEFPFIVLSPQCPEDKWWSYFVDELEIFVESMFSIYPVDTNRVYLTGFSMGGYGTWYLAARRPEWFSAIAPVCGRGPKNRACNMKDMGVWIFHGEKDEVVDFQYSLDMYTALQTCGAPNLKFSRFPEAGHMIDSLAYDNDSLYTWLLSFPKE